MEKNEIPSVCKHSGAEYGPSSPVLLVSDADSSAAVEYGLSSALKIK